MVETVYLLCAATSGACALLLLARLPPNGDTALVVEQSLLRRTGTQ